MNIRKELNKLSKTELEKTQCKRMLEQNKIYNMDCLEGMKQLPDNSIDLVVTSPPYDNLREYKGYNFDFKPIANELYRITKKGGIVVWIVGDATIKGSETGSSFKQALYFMDCGFRLHDTMIYQKHNFSSPSTNRYHQIFEYMFILSKSNPKTFNPIKDRKNIRAGKIGNYGVNTVTNKDGSKSIRNKKIIQPYGMRYNIWKYVTSGAYTSKIYKHPAIFPEKLADAHILSWSNEGDLVFDPMCGSGTTLVACKRLNRQFIGFEINKEYYDISMQRLRSMTENLDRWMEKL